MGAHRLFYGVAVPLHQPASIITRRESQREPKGQRVEGYNGENYDVRGRVKCAVACVRPV